MATIFDKKEKKNPKPGELDLTLTLSFGALKESAEFLSGLHQGKVKEIEKLEDKKEELEDPNKIAEKKAKINEKIMVLRDELEAFEGIFGRTKTAKERVSAMCEQMELPLKDAEKKPDNVTDIKLKQEEKAKEEATKKKRGRPKKEEAEKKIAGSVGEEPIANFKL